MEDCNDDDSSIYPTAARLEPSLCTIDQDGDGYGDSQLDDPGDRGSDCNDENQDIYPGSLPLEGPLFYWTTTKMDMGIKCRIPTLLVLII